MAPWTRMLDAQVGSDAPAIFTRPLGLTELAFYWEASLSGGTDTLQLVTMETDHNHAPRIFSQQNIERTWVAVKKLHPLLGACVHEDSDSDVHFVVDEARLSSISPDEIVYTSRQSDDEAQALADKILTDPPLLSNQLPARLWIISLPHSPEEPLVCHQIIFHTAHCVCDGVGQNAVYKSFFDILVHEGVPDLYIPTGTLESRLAPLSAVEDLYPARKYTVAKQRWRLAIAGVIYMNREAAMKGGHTLLRNITPQTGITPAVSRTLRITLPKDVSERIVVSCRQARMTLGDVLPILAQLAHARILHRLRHQGQISDEDWDYRSRQPMYMIGPSNLRPYLDHERIANGGANNVFLAISHFQITLPFMPGFKSRSGDDSMTEPQFGDLLSRARFLHRGRVVRKQMLSYSKHPLLTELTTLMRPVRISRAKAAALTWRKQQLTALSQLPPIATAGLAFQDQADYVLANRCSSFGNLENMIPLKYPIEQAESKVEMPLLRLTSVLAYVRARPADLYLSSLAYAGKISFVLFCDTGVYGEDLAMRWLVEVGRAAEWYLGSDNARQARL